jgi:hypothetical protein
VPTNVQNVELDDITSIWDKFPSIIDKIKEAGMLLKYDKIEGRKFEGHPKTNIMQNLFDSSKFTSIFK